MQQYIDSRNHSEVRLKSANLIKECINNQICVAHQAMHKQATVFSIGTNLLLLFILSLSCILRDYFFL